MRGLHTNFVKLKGSFLLGILFKLLQKLIVCNELISFRAWLSSRCCLSWLFFAFSFPMRNQSTSLSIIIK